MKTSASLLIERLGRKMFSTKEVEQLQEISYLEGKHKDDEMNKKISEFKSQFVLSDSQWEGKDDDDIISIIEIGEGIGGRKNRIKEQIIEYKSIINELENELNEININYYGFLVGRCYELSATSVVKVISVDSYNQNNNTIYLECIYIYGGKHGHGTLEVKRDIFDFCLNGSDIEQDGAGNLHLIIPYHTFREISEEDFIKFLSGAIDDNLLYLEEIKKKLA